MCSGGKQDTVHKHHQKLRPYAHTEQRAALDFEGENVAQIQRVRVALHTFGAYRGQWYW